MSEPGMGTDHSNVRPSRRANLPRGDPLHALGRARLFRRLRKTRRRSPVLVENHVDLTEVEGSPGQRAQVEVPLDFGANLALRTFWTRSTRRKRVPQRSESLPPDTG